MSSKLRKNKIAHSAKNNAKSKGIGHRLLYGMAVKEVLGKSSPRSSKKLAIRHQIGGAIVQAFVIAVVR